MTRLFLTLVIASMACGSEYQRIRMDVPVGAVFHVPAGYGSTERTFATPFAGEFEIGRLKVSGAIPLVIDLDETAAKRIGGDRAMKLYGRLSVGKQTEFSRTQTLHLAPSEDSLRSLVRGEVSEISAFVTDPHAGGRKLAVITLRMAPF